MTQASILKKTQESELSKIVAFPQEPCTIERMTTTQKSISNYLRGLREPSQRAQAGLAVLIGDAVVGLHKNEWATDSPNSFILMLEHADSAGAGVPVSIAARLLEVSEPTVRAWIVRGVLNEVKGARPIKVTARSLGEVIGIVSFVRERIGDEPRLLQYLSEQAEFADLRRRILEMDQSTELHPGHVEEELFG